MPGIDHCVGKKTLTVFCFRNRFIDADDCDRDEKKQKSPGQAALPGHSVNGKERNETDPEVFC